MRSTAYHGYRGVKGADAISETKIDVTLYDAMLSGERIGKIFDGKREIEGDGLDMNFQSSDFAACNDTWNRDELSKICDGLLAAEEKEIEEDEI